MRALPLSRTRTPLGQHAQQGGIGTNHRLDTYFTRVCSNRTLVELSGRRAEDTGWSPMRLAS